MHFKPNMQTIQIAISSDLCIRLTWNLTGSCGQQQRLRGWSRMVVKQVQDGGRPPFWKSIYRHISVKNHPILWNFVHSSRFWTGWTSRDQKWKTCIGQTPSSTEHISYLLIISAPEILLVFHHVSWAHHWSLPCRYRKSEPDRTWKDLTKVQSSVRIPSPRLSSLTSRMTRNSRKKLILIVELSNCVAQTQPAPTLTTSDSCRQCLTIYTAKVVIVSHRII